MAITSRFLIEQGRKRAVATTREDAERIYSAAIGHDPITPIRIRQWIYDHWGQKWDLWFDSTDPTTWTAKEVMA